MTLEKMKQADVKTVKREDLMDIHDVMVDRSLPKDERIRNFIRQVKNWKSVETLCI